MTPRFDRKGNEEYGVYLSNTCHLVRDLGWDGVLIEGSAEKFAELT